MKTQATNKACGRYKSNGKYTVSDRKIAGISVFTETPLPNSESIRVLNRDVFEGAILAAAKARGKG
ncbi:hypothetical protein K8I31_18385 [bacterium]|nr:hypothetical protein [bacterium]